MKKVYMIKIDYKQTEDNAKLFIDNMTSAIIETGWCTVERIQLLNIDDNTDLRGLVHINADSQYNNVILNTLESISKMSLGNKQILYCIHLLNIKRKNLRNDYGPYEYSFGNPFYTYEKALREFGLSNMALIVLYESNN